MAQSSSGLFNGEHAVRVDPEELKRARLDRRGFTLRLEKPNPSAGLPTGLFCANVQFELLPVASENVSKTGQELRWHIDSWLRDDGAWPPGRLVTEMGIVVFTQSSLANVAVFEGKPFVEGLGPTRRVKIRVTAQVNETTCEGSVHAEVLAISQDLAAELRKYLSCASS